MAILNRRARFDYFIEQTWVAGIMLVGSEVKSIRLGAASLNEAFVMESDGELFLHNCHISPYKQARVNPEPTRPRKLLCRKREIDKIMGNVQKKGYTCIPLKIFFNERGMAKVEIAIAKGKAQHDKRATTKDRDWERQKAKRDFD